MNKILHHEMARSILATFTRVSAYSTYSSTLTLKYAICRRIRYTVSAKTQTYRSYKVMASSTISVPKQDKITAPYGSWKSPITADVVSGSSKRLDGTAVDGHGHLIWLESRPTESGYTKHVNNLPIKFYLHYYLFFFRLPSL